MQSPASLQHRRIILWYYGVEFRIVTLTPPTRLPSWVLPRISRHSVLARPPSSGTGISEFESHLYSFRWHIYSAAP